MIEAAIFRRGLASLRLAAAVLLAWAGIAMADGDPGIMRQTVALAVANKVLVGAHPAYPDLQGFGRRSMACSDEEIRDLLHYQIGALDGLCRVQGIRVAYVKPHGALYNDMMANPAQLRAVIG